MKIEKNFINKFFFICDFNEVDSSIVYFGLVWFRSVFIFIIFIVGIVIFFYIGIRDDKELFIVFYVKFICSIILKNLFLFEYNIYFYCVYFNISYN